MACTFTKAELDRFCELAKECEKVENDLRGYASVTWTPMRMMPRSTFERISSVTGARIERRCDGPNDKKPLDMIAYNGVLFYAFTKEREAATL
ncbi:MAG: hypothetical protein IKL97_03540 [Eggerthellaceae bacterium]|nr:hypothetical protein [Eggerthellaceae bacterium]